jgi:hypothetical protein
MSEIKSFWKRVYLNKFGIKVDFSKINIPKEYYNNQEYFIVLMPKNLSLEKVLRVIKKEFGFWFYTELDNLKFIFDKKDLLVRKNSLAIFKKKVDPEFKFVRNEDLISVQEGDFINLIERSLLELMFFYQSGEHLDADKETLCLSTIDADGCPAVTFWDREKKEFSIFFLEEEPLLENGRSLYSREKVYGK